MKAIQAEVINTHPGLSARDKRKCFVSMGKQFLEYVTTKRIIPGARTHMINQRNLLATRNHR